MPTMIQWLVCLISPVNGSMRYAMLLYLMVPILFVLSFKDTVDEINK